MSPPPKLPARSRFVRHACLAGALLSHLAALPAGAITRTWDDGGADQNFNNPANWDPTGAPVDGDDLVFPSTMADTMVDNNLTGRTYGSITIQKGLTIGGNAFTLTGGLVSTPAGTGGTVVVGPNITLGAGQTFTSGGGVLSTLTFSGNVVFGTHSLTLAGSRPLTFGGITGSNAARSQLIRTATGQLRFGPSAIFISSNPFTWTAGSLDVDGIFQAPFNLAGGTLTGAGSLGVGLDASGGVIVPDEDDLTVSGATLLRGSVIVRVELTGPSDEHALECNGGTVTIQDNATLEMAANGYVPVRGDVFNVLQKSTAGAITGAFSNAAEGVEFADGTSIVRFSYLGGNGNDGVLATVSVPRTWDGGATLNDNWDDPDNWNANVAPLAGDILVFPAGIGSTDRGLDNNFPNDSTFRKIVFNGDDFTVRGNRLRLTHGIVLGFVTGQANVDTDVTLAADQTVEFGTATAFEGDRILHFDLLDRVDTDGSTLTLNGIGRMEGKISGAGGVRIGAGATVSLAANSDYTGPTLIEEGASVTVSRESSLGTTEGGTEIKNGGCLVIPGGDILGRDFDEPLILHEGGTVETDGFGVGDIRMRGAIDLRGPGEAGGFFSSNSLSRFRLAGPITGPGILFSSGVTSTIEGDSHNTYSGGTGVRNKLILQKSDPGVIAIPGPTLELERSPDDTVLETQQDEQIADDCHVIVKGNSMLNIGNVTARTETIGALTFAGEAGSGGKADGPLDSELVVRGNITVTSGPTTDPHGIALTLRVEGLPSVLDVSSTNPGAVDLTTSGVTAASGASLRKTGDGTVSFRGDNSVPVEVISGTARFDTIGSTSLVTLNGGAVGGTGSTGIITGAQGGGTVRPGGTLGNGVPASLAVLDSGALIWNGATTLEIEVRHPTITEDNSNGYDRLVVAGSVSLGNAILEINEQSGFSVAVGQTIFPLLNDGADAIVGTFAGLPQGAFIPIPEDNGGGGWIISYTGGTGNDVVLARVATPPVEVEPTVTTVTFGEPDQNGNRPVTIAGEGTPGASYRLESSVDFIVWTPEGTAQMANATTGALSFSTTASEPVRPAQFWRFRRL